MVVDTLQDAVKGQLVWRQECRRKNLSARVICHSLACSNIGENIAKPFAVSLIRTFKLSNCVPFVEKFQNNKLQCRNHNFLAHFILTSDNMTNTQSMKRWNEEKLSSETRVGAGPRRLSLLFLVWLTLVLAWHGCKHQCLAQAPKWSQTAWSLKPLLTWVKWNKRRKNLDSYVKIEETIEERTYSLSLPVAWST